MENTPTWAVLLSIKKEHAANIYAGTKRVELRKTVPLYFAGCLHSRSLKYPFRAYMYESKTGGGAGTITGFFDCPGYIGMDGGVHGKYPETMAVDAQVTMEDLEAYGNGGWVYAWTVANPTRLPCQVPLERLHINRPPQSWQYLGKVACMILGAEMPGGL